MTAIQKAREALGEALRQLDINVSIARRDHPEGPIIDGKRLNIDALPHSQDILASHVKDRIREALAALDAETPATPADVGEEPVAFLHPNGAVWRADNCPDYIKDKDRLAEGWTALYSATALERVVGDRDEARARLQTAYQVKAEMNDLANAERHARLAAEAKLAEARKVIERFARLADNYTNRSPSDAVFANGSVFVSDIRAARRFLEETK